MVYCAVAGAGTTVTHRASGTKPAGAGPPIAVRCEPSGRIRSTNTRPAQSTVGMLGAHTITVTWPEPEICFGASLVWAEPLPKNRKIIAAETRQIILKTVRVGMRV